MTEPFRFYGAGALHGVTQLVIQWESMYKLIGNTVKWDLVVGDEFRNIFSQSCSVLTNGDNIIPNFRAIIVIYSGQMALRTGWRSWTQTWNTTGSFEI